MINKDRLLETARLRMRNFRESDIGPCWESWGQDESLGRYIVSYPMGDIRQMRDLVQGFLTNTDAWVIEDKGSEKIVGSGS